MADLIQVNVDNSDIMRWLGELYFTTKHQGKAIEILEIKIKEMGEQIRQLRGN